MLNPAFQPRVLDLERVTTFPRVTQFRVPLFPLRLCFVAESRTTRKSAQT